MRRHDPERYDSVPVKYMILISGRKFVYERGKKRTHRNRISSIIVKRFVNLNYYTNTILQPSRL